VDILMEFLPYFQAATLVLYPFTLAALLVASVAITYDVLR